MEKEKLTNIQPDLKKIQDMKQKKKISKQVLNQKRDIKLVLAVLFN